VKSKYHEAGRPAYTKIDLANRAREDGLDPDGNTP
jgi:two-component system nitrate/nitrite response regulator NarL